MKLKYIVLVLLLYPLSLFSNDCSGIPNGAGFGPNQPSSIVCTINASAETITITWTTASPATSHVLLGLLLTQTSNNQNVDFVRHVCDTSPCSSSTLVTSHSVTISNLSPGNYSDTPSKVIYQFSVGGCIHTGNCVPNDAWSTNPWPNASWWQTAFFIMPAAPAGTLTWQAFTWGGNPLHVFAGSPINVQLSLFETVGTFLQAYTVTTETLTWNSGNCLPATITGSTCTGTGSTIKVLCPGNEPNNSTGYNIGVSSGKYSCSSVRLVDTVSGLVLRIETGTIAPGTYTLAGTLQARNAGVAVGSTVAFSQSIQVEAAPSFSVAPPTIFPAIPSLGTWLARQATWATTNCNNFITANSLGLFLNDNMSASQTAIYPYDNFNYNGIGVWEQVKDRVNLGQPIARLNSNPYNIGDSFTVNGYVWTITTAGTSASSPPAYLGLPGTTQADGTATATNSGNTTYWNTCIEALGEQWLNWELLNPKYSINSEYNIFPLGVVTWAIQRQGDHLPESHNGLGLKGTNYTGGINQAGLSNQNVAGASYRNIFYGTIRNLPYTLEAIAARCDPSITGSNAATVTCLKSVEMLKRVDLLINTLDVVINCSPFDGVTSTPAFCTGAPVFDWGLGCEALYYYYDMLYNANSGISDARIPVMIGRLLDFSYSHYFNQTGTDNTFPYQPFQPQVNYPAYVNNAQLNNLNAPAFAWYFALNPNGTTLPTSGTTLQTAADNVFNGTLQVVPFSGKSFNEEYKSFRDFEAWRSNYWVGTQSQFLGAQNPFEGTYPDTAPPFNNYCGITCAGFPPPITTTTTSSVTAGSNVNVPVSSSTNFVVGYQIQIQNGATIDVTLITVIPDGTHITLKTLANNHAAGATLYVPEPKIFNLTGSSVTISWYTWKQIITGQIHLGSVPTNCGSPATIGSFTSNAVVGQDSVFLNTANLTGLGTATTYYPSVGGVDFAGNLSQSPCNTGSFLGNSKANQFISFTTLSGTVIITTTPPTLPNGNVGLAYPTNTISVSGGVAPYTITISSCLGGCTGSPPNIPGLTLNTLSGSTATETGTPTTPGTYGITIHALDSVGNTGNKPYSIVISPNLGGGIVTQGMVKSGVQVSQ